MKYKKLSLIIALILVLITAGVIIVLFMKRPEEKVSAKREESSGPAYPTPESVVEAYFYNVVVPYAYDFRDEKSVVDVQSVTGYCLTPEMYNAFLAFANLMGSGYKTSGKWKVTNYEKQYEREKNPFLSDPEIYDSRLDYEKGSDVYYFDLLFLEFMYKTSLGEANNTYDSWRQSAADVSYIGDFQVTGKEDWNTDNERYGRSVPDGQGGIADATTAVEEDNAYFRLLGLGEYQIPEADEYKRVCYSYEVETYSGLKTICDASVLTVRYGDEWYIYFDYWHDLY